MSTIYYTVCDSCGAREEGWPSGMRAVLTGWARVEQEMGDPKDLCPQCWSFRNNKPATDAPRP